MIFIACLEFGRGAAQDDLRRAYRRKAKTSHPDSGGSVGAFGEIATAYAVLSDPERRERYDLTGEIDPPRADTLDASAIEVIAQKLGLIIHAEQDVTALDIGALIEGAIREDMAQRRANIASHSRAIERTTKLRTRVKRKANGQDNMLAKVLDWHEACGQRPDQEERGGGLFARARARHPQGLFLRRGAGAAGGCRGRFDRRAAGA